MYVTALTARPTPAMTPRTAPEPGETPRPLPDFGEDGLGRRVVEGIGGFLGAASKIPGAVLPCLVGGALRGADKTASDKKIGLALDITNGVQASVTLGLALNSGGGLGGFVDAFLTKGLIGGVTVAMVSRGGSSEELARQIGAQLDPSRSGFKGALEGAGVGLKTAVVGGWTVGWQEGRGYAHGILQAWDHAGNILKGKYESLESPSRKPSIIGAAVGVATGVLMIPPGLAQGLAEALGTPGHWSPKLVATVACLGTAGMGAYLGSCCGGPAAILIGAGAGLGVGALVAYRGAARIAERIREQVHTVHQEAPDLGQAITNKNRDFVGGGLLGGLAGFRAGYLEGYRAVRG